MFFPGNGECFAWCHLRTVHPAFVFVPGVCQCELFLSRRNILILFAADELFYLVSSETLKKCFLEGAEKGPCLAGFKLSCFVSLC